MSRKRVDIQNPLLLPSWCVQNIFHLNRALSRTNRAKRERCSLRSLFVYHGSLDRYDRCLDVFLRSKQHIYYLVFVS